VFSYRAGLATIGVSAGASVSYRAFASRPPSLRQAIRSMAAPGGWSQVDDLHLDEDWTQGCQGVVFDGARWIFSSNGSANPAALDVTPKALFLFDADGPLDDDHVVGTFRLGPHIPAIDHVGQLCIDDDHIYVSHFNDKSSHVIVIKNNHGTLEYVDRIEVWREGSALELPKHPTTHQTNRLEFQAVNPWDKNFYTSFGAAPVDQFFSHDPKTGAWTGKSITLDVPIKPVLPFLIGGILDPHEYPVQGAVFSPNGHLYVASNVRFTKDLNYQTIWCYSALNGHLFEVIPVLAEESNQELEGICYADRSWPDGRRAQLWAVLLENIVVAKDNLFFKAFGATEPDLV
jgi:hypothetical protein